MLLTPLDRIAVFQIVGGTLAVILAFWLVDVVLGVPGLLRYGLFGVVLLAHGLWIGRAFDRLSHRSPPQDPQEAHRTWPPDRIAINHDDHHATHVGRTADGRQFFLTTPFEPQIDGNAGKEFVALFLFDADGRFLESKIDELGPRDTLDKAKRTQIFDNRMRELGEVTFERIEVAPFHVTRFGTMFGLIPRPPEDDDDSWWVELHPGNYMAFHEPFDSGVYDT